MTLLDCLPGNGRSTAETEPGDLFARFAHALQPHLSAPKQELDAQAVREIVADMLANIAPRRIEIVRPDGSQYNMPADCHARFGDLVQLVNEGHNNILLSGPAGTGKTTLAKTLAQALGRDFGFLSLSAGVTETHLFGRILPQADGSWQYQPSRFVEIYENGGVFLLDEIDAADANVMVAINAALANGVLANPNGRIHHRHADCIIIAAANTWGRGGDTQYVGRNQLDSATLDRFVLATLQIGYDSALESRILGLPSAKAQDPDSDGIPATPEQIQAWVSGLRDCISRNKLRRVASTRLVHSAMRAAQAGRTIDQIKARYFVDWSADEARKAGYYHA